MGRKKSINELEEDLRMYREIQQGYKIGTPEHTEISIWVSLLEEKIPEYKLESLITWDARRGTHEPPTDMD